MITQEPRKARLSLMLHMIAPNRLAIYSGLADHFDLLLSHGGTENNRDTWSGLDKEIPNAKVKQAWGWKIQAAKRANGKFFDHRYLHITPGFIWHLLRFRPDAIISNEMGFRTLIALLYGTVARVPVWVWWGGTLHTERKVGIVRRALRFLISRWAKNWISYGQTSTEYLMTLGISQDHILEAQNSVDERRFSEAAEPVFELKPKPVVLHVGQFIGRKGIDLLLKASAVLQNEGHEFSLLLVGSGRDKSDLQALAQDLHLKDVHFEPGQAPLKMRAVYRSADVLIFPTLEDVWGLVANEAMLCGLPVLCSKYAGCATELFPEQSIFDPQDPGEFVQKLRDAVTSHLPQPDCSRLRTTPEIVNRLVHAINSSLSDRMEGAHSSTVGQSG